MAKRGPGADSIAVVHADESCLGNGQDGWTPGGAASLIEVRTKDRIVRRDVFISSPATTNNRMALAGAIATFALLSKKGQRLRVAYVSDSQYLVKGMAEWVPQWRDRGWRRKRGKIENLELWQTLVRVAEPHAVSWMWVRGHVGHPKNEYANDLAMRSAAEQLSSEGTEPSHFLEWLARRQQRGQFAGYDPEQAFAEVESRMMSEQT